MNSASFRDTVARQITRPLVPILTKSRLTPNTLTWLGLAIILAAAGAIATNHLLIGGLLVLFSGLFDLLDGALARFTGQTSIFGALLDSTVDRVSEAIVLLSLLGIYIWNGHTIEILLVFLAVVGSFLISYVRARAEGLGIECRVGLFTRAERVIILALGLLLNQILIALLILVVLSFVTVGQRLVHIWQQTRGQ